MKRIYIVAIALLTVSSVAAQKKSKNYDAVLNRAGDHLMIQFSSDHWLGAPDSINNHIKSISRGFNAYVMMNKPFKNSPKLSAAFGLGISTSSMFFSNMSVDVHSLTTSLPFTNLDSSNHFKKYKLSTAYLELPVELRYTFDPLNENKSIKIAIGAKVGTLLNAHTKAKSPVDKNGNSLNSYIEKENSKRFVNATRLALTGRIGYGHYSLFGVYQVNTIFKSGTATDMKLLQVGLTISGL
jgi:hypothetical protein